jgi:hypothetical protein
LITALTDIAKDIEARRSIEHKLEIVERASDGFPHTATNDAVKFGHDYRPITTTRRNVLSADLKSPSTPNQQREFWLVSSELLRLSSIDQRTIACDFISYCQFEARERHTANGHIPTSLSSKRS